MNKVKRSLSKVKEKSKNIVNWKGSSSRVNGSANNDPNSSMPQCSNSINIIIVGDEGCGKTQIVNSYLYDTFDTEYTPSFFSQLSCELNLGHNLICKHSELSTLVLNI